MLYDSMIARATGGATFEFGDHYSYSFQPIHPESALSGA